MSRPGSRKTRKSAYRKTRDEVMREILSGRLIPALQGLTFGVYRRAHDGAVKEPGYLVHPGDYQMLMMYLEWASKPRGRGPPVLSGLAKLEEWDKYHHEFEQVKREIEAETENERGSTQAAIKKLAEKWRVSEDAVRKRISFTEVRKMFR
jgi:hypothetical protein